MNAFLIGRLAADTIKWRVSMRAFYRLFDLHALGRWA